MGTEQQNKPGSSSDNVANAEKQRAFWWFNQPAPIDRFTGWLVAWTALLFVATIVNAVMLAVTDLTLKETLAETRKSADAAKLSADTQVAASERQLRAYVFLEPAEAQWDGNGNIGVVITAKNVGISPAYRMELSHAIAIFDGQNPPEAIFRQIELHPSEIYGDTSARPYVFQNSSSTLHIFEALDDDDIAVIKKPLSVVVVCVRIRYDDVFKKRRTSHICRKAFGKEFAPFIPVKGKDPVSFTPFWVPGYEEDD